MFTMENLTNLRNSDLRSLVNRLEEDRLRKRDIVVPSDLLSVRGGQVIVQDVAAQVETSALDLLLSNIGGVSRAEETAEAAEATETVLEVLGIAHSDLAERLGVPAKYYGRMRTEALDLFDHTLTYWLRKANKNYLLRTFAPWDGETEPGILRAVLSDRFRLIDDYDVLITALDAIRGTGADVRVEHCDLTDRRMYVRFVSPEVEVKAPELLRQYREPGTGKAGDGVITGFVISNSETGHGSFTITPRGLVKVCRNGLLRKKDALTKVHAGQRLEEGIITWSEATILKERELVMAQTADAVTRFVSPDYLGRVISEIEEGGIAALKNPAQAVRNVCAELQVPKDKAEEVLAAFYMGGDLTTFGVTQALTYYAQRAETGDDQFDLEAGALEILPKIAKEFDKAAVLA
jgi:hypothetical protein